MADNQEDRLTIEQQISRLEQLEVKLQAQLSELMQRPERDAFTVANLHYMIESVRSEIATLYDKYNSIKEY